MPFKAVSKSISLQVQLLPVQVRQAQDKLTVVRKAMDDCPSICRDSNRLLDLARLLGLTGKDQIAKVKDMAARQLLSGLEGGGAVGDKVLLEMATSFVLQLMREGHAFVWDLCENLASSDGIAVGNANMRLAMARFALGHCEPQAIDRLLALCTRLQCRGDAGEGTIELAKKGLWVAIDDWSRGVMSGGGWASRPRNGVVRNAFYHVDKPRCGMVNTPEVLRFDCVLIATAIPACPHVRCPLVRRPLVR